MSAISVEGWTFSHLGSGSCGGGGAAKSIANLVTDPGIPEFWADLISF